MLSALTDTSASGAVQGETVWTLTAERALRVHTLAVRTHPGEHLALINVYSERDILKVVVKDSKRKAKKKTYAGHVRLYLHRRGPSYEQTLESRQCLWKTDYRQ